MLLRSLLHQETILISHLFHLTYYLFHTWKKTCCENDMGGEGCPHRISLTLIEQLASPFQGEGEPGAHTNLA